MAEEVKYQSIHTGAELDAAVSDIKNGVIEGYKNDAAQSANEASQSALNASDSENAARLEANRSEQVAVTTPYLSDRNTWMVWDRATETYKDSGRSGVGPVGPDGPIGPTGPDGEIGPTGPKGDPFVYTDFTPEQLEALTGPVGPQGQKGDTGAKGDKGDTGAIGPQGLQGEKGDTGLTGPQGPQGIQGTQGEQGPQGIQGPKGDKGADGRSLQIEDVYPTLDELKNAFPTGTIGAFQVSADMNLYIWSETALQWESIGELQGPPGPEGPQGPAGNQGLVGPQGPAGQNGEQGPQGVQGLQGETGAIGPSGPKGEKGDTGERGAIGPIGPIGPVGPKGDTGPAGPPPTIKQVNATLTTAGWSGTSPFTQTLPVSGLLASQSGDIGLAQSATATQREAARGAMLSVTGQAVGSLTITADGDKPIVDLPVTVTMLG